MNNPSDKGALYLIPSRLGDNPPLEVLPLSIKRVIESLDHYIVENEKTARRFIKRVSPGKSQSKLKINILNKFTDPIELTNFLNPCLNGISVGLISEAGCPGIADPGAEIVSMAHAKDIRVRPLVGPSSILLAMMSSGFNGQNFAFNGYLPIDNGERRNSLKKFERISRETGQAQIFIETPYRNDKLLEEICRVLKQETKLCIASDITLPTEYIKSAEISEWKKIKVDLHKRPTIFILQS